MADEQRDINWFMENEVDPTDEQLAEMALNDGVVTVSDSAATTDDQTATDTAAAETAAATTAEPAAAAPSETGTTEDAPTSAKPEGMSDEEWAEVRTLVVKTKDGKGEIPFDVLGGSRQQVAALKAQNDELQQQVTDAKTAAEASAPASGTAPTGEVSPEVLATEFERIHGQSYEDLTAEFGEEQAKLFLNPIRENLLLRQDLANLQEAVASAPVDSGGNDAVQDAIDAIPSLAQWQQLDGAMWKEALAEDAHLRASPRWADQPIQDRFDEVARRLGGEVPDRTTTTDTSSDGKTAAEKAAEVLAKAADNATAPTSLSSIPGSSPAAETLADQAEGMSETELVDLAVTNPAKMQELLDAIP